MVAERRDRSGKKKKSSYVRVGYGFADDRKLKAKIRGNTGDGEPYAGNGDGVLLPLRNPDTNRPYTYLPSEAWVDTHFTEIQDIDADGLPIIVRVFYRGAKESPLNGAATAMVRCAICGHLCPPEALEGGVCMDHRPEQVQDAYGSSPSAAVIQEFRAMNRDPQEAKKIERARLKPESKSALRREIKRFMKYKWVPKS